MCLSKESEWACNMGIHAFVVLDRKVGINFQVPKYVTFCFSICFELIYHGIIVCNRAEIHLLIRYPIH